MFFILSKTVAFCLLPSNFLLLLALAGVVLLATRFQARRHADLAGAVVLLAIGRLFPVGTLLIHALESRFPPWDPRAARRTVSWCWAARSRRSSRASTASRSSAPSGRASFALAKLARAYPNARIVYSGGDASLLAGVREADFVDPLLDSLASRARGCCSKRARATPLENAAFTKNW